ncbi:hypothetical protein Tco_1425073, partial [Tanacetum coccineum]
VSEVINENNVKALFGVKFTSQSDIKVFSMSIKEGKYADTLSTMYTADIDAAVDAIETIRKQFQDDVSNSSPLVSPSTTINVPRELNSIDAAATFRVSLSTIGDLHKLINDIEAELGDPIIDDNPSVMASPNVPNTNDNIAGKALTSDHIVESVDISKSFTGAAGASSKEHSNFRPLVADPVYDGVNISIPRKVVEKVSTCLEHTLYGYFIGKRLAFSVVEYYARNN